MRIAKLFKDKIHYPRTCVIGESRPSLVGSLEASSSAAYALRSAYDPLHYDKDAYYRLFVSIVDLTIVVIALQDARSAKALEHGASYAPPESDPWLAWQGSEQTEEVPGWRGPRAAESRRHCGERSGTARQQTWQEDRKPRAPESPEET